MTSCHFNGDPDMNPCKWEEHHVISLPCPGVYQVASFSVTGQTCVSVLLVSQQSS